MIYGVTCHFCFHPKFYVLYLFFMQKNRYENKLQLYSVLHIFFHFYIDASHL